MKQQKEHNLSVMISQYMQLKHKNIIFRFDVADLKLTMPQAVRLKAIQGDNAGYPDMFIAFANKSFHGLYLELKHSKDEYLKKDGSLRESVHIQKQAKMHDKLIRAGYYATFAGGYKEAVEIIESYFDDLIVLKAKENVNQGVLF